MMKYLEKRMRCARYAWAYTHIRDSSFVFAQWKTENEKKNWKCLKGLRAAARDTSIMMNWLASQSRAFSKRQAEGAALRVLLPFRMMEYMETGVSRRANWPFKKESSTFFSFDQSSAHKWASQWVDESASLSFAPVFFIYFSLSLEIV